MKLRRFSVLFFVLLLILTMGCQTVTPQTVVVPYSGGVATYVNTEFEFSVDYPEGWVVKEEVWPSGFGSDIGFFKVGLPSVSMMLYKPMDEPSYDFRSLEDFYKRGVIGGWEDYEGFELLSERNIVVGGLPAKELTFTYTMMEYVMKHSIVAFLDTRHTSPPACNAIKIIYDAPTDMYGDHCQYFRFMVDTFEFFDYT